MAKLITERNKLDEQGIEQYRNPRTQAFRRKVQMTISALILNESSDPTSDLSHAELCEMVYNEAAGWMINSSN